MKQQKREQRRRWMPQRNTYTFNRTNQIGDDYEVSAAEIVSGFGVWVRRRDEQDGGHGDLWREWLVYLMETYGGWDFSRAELEALFERARERRNP